MLRTCLNMSPFDEILVLPTFDNARMDPVLTSSPYLTHGNCVCWAHMSLKDTEILAELPSECVQQGCAKCTASFFFFFLETSHWCFRFLVHRDWYTYVQMRTYGTWTSACIRYYLPGVSILRRLASASHIYSYSSYMKLLERKSVMSDADDTTIVCSLPNLRRNTRIFALLSTV